MTKNINEIWAQYAVPSGISFILAIGPVVRVDVDVVYPGCSVIGNSEGVAGVREVVRGGDVAAQG